jgi:hypothetical protein
MSRIVRASGLVQQWKQDGRRNDTQYSFKETKTKDQSSRDFTSNGATLSVCKDNMVNSLGNYAGVQQNYGFQNFMRNAASQCSK